MSIINQNSGEAILIWVGSQTEHEALASKDANTLYFVRQPDGTIISPDPDPEPEPDSDGTVVDDVDPPQPIPTPNSLLDARTLISGDTLSFDTAGDDSFSENLVITNPKVFETALATGDVNFGSSTYRFIKREFGQTIEYTDKFLLISSPVEQTNGQYGALYVYSWENIQRVRDLNVYQMNHTELNDLLKSEGFYNPGPWDGLIQGMYIGNKRTLTANLLLAPERLSVGSFRTDVEVITYEDLPDDQEHWSGAEPRYEWSEYVDADAGVVSVLLVWNNEIVRSLSIPIGSTIPITVLGLTDQRSYTRGSEVGSYANDSKYYAIIRDGE